MKPKRVLLVDDHDVFLRTAARLVQSIPDLEVVGQASRGDRAIELIATLHPDLVLMDLSMPGMSGLAATRRIKRQHDGPKVIIVTLHNEREYRDLARDAGADGFISKDDLVVELPTLVATLFAPADCSSKSILDSDSAR